ncbi:endonuclease MutS2 [Priestia megaterium]|uniref:Endonuclease MutS2 n=3 Tax=Priestia megaterium TaxID=1404 RepID=A0A6M6DPG8_PRIMG|nr:MULTISPECIES: endonuclease MutS2 [Priestia]AJI20458.1 MutS2 family protein [Priestia megaterium NBRC 15308 = ATCC 14581]KFN00558.1 MutS2 family protein [Priestia megaterium]KGJ86002.1 recombination and DNA strand exchange inhibitor protein [Priestia megaterium NBRC 15308 = ATCC 14581]KLV33139.1 recombination and DNA strand exchange inhibitor protein [Priestia megaterium]MBU8755745.1 endonuclease MutS2 [Priestia megaterium]
MQSRIFHVLEFNKVKEQLQKKVASSLGREKVANLIPSTQYEEVVKWQEATDEATTVLRLRGNVPLGGIFDVRPSVKRAEIGGTLSSNELLDVASTIYAARQVKQFIEQVVEDEDLQLSIITEHIEKLMPLPEVEQTIKMSIDENGTVLDGASDQLRGIRQKLRSTESRIREKLESLIRSSSAQKMLSDAIVTIRNERFVIPVKQEYRSAYGGIVHDQSSSGATLFIEPQAIVTLNNELQEAKVKEKQEIERILIALTVQVAEVANELRQNVYLLGELDFMFAKGRYSHELKASKPKMNDRGYIKLVKAKHPLIAQEDVVANDIELGDQYTSIVITGPNTGGKTVTLKTLGLFTLMAQAGLQIPALDGSEMAVFKHVFADIGDEQSIEQSLSTFSSHMVNIVDILQKVDHESLVLFDELGAGTDPQEGAALAISILDQVYERGARVVATTHYPELKAYGYNREGVVNASVEFDIETLSPTYKLLIGVPGRSNAFEISKRLGLSAEVIERAKGYIGSETNKVENMIASLEDSRRQSEHELEEAEELRKEAQKLHKELQSQIIEFNEKRDKLYEKAEEKAQATVKAASEEAEKIISDLRKMSQKNHALVKEHELIEARKRLEDAVPTLEKSKKKPAVPKKQERTLQAGDEVKVLSWGQKGTLVERVSNNEWQVQMGIMKMKVKEKDLEYISSPKPVETKPLATVKGKDYHVNLELDLRGERYENALIRVEKYIDDALLANYPRVSIIHGKGTGALRKGVQEYLKNHRSVKNIRFGEASEGGSGVTVVEFK